MTWKHGFTSVKYSVNIPGLTPELEALNSWANRMKAVIISPGFEKQQFSLETFLHFTEGLTVSILPFSFVSTSGSLSVSEYDSLSECSMSLSSHSSVKFYSFYQSLDLTHGTSSVYCVNLSFVQPP
jgi:hypothetical protein